VPAAPSHPSSLNRRPNIVPILAAPHAWLTATPEILVSRCACPAAALAASALSAALDILALQRSCHPNWLDRNRISQACLRCSAGPGWSYSRDGAARRLLDGVTCQASDRQPPSLGADSAGKTTSQFTRNPEPLHPSIFNPIEV
jgi:hypothetical protein